MNVKNSIITVACSLFELRGIRSVNMDEICKTLHISKKTLYRNFENKDLLVQEATNQYFRNLQQEITSAASEENPVETALRLWAILTAFYNKYSPVFQKDLQYIYPEVWKLHVNYRSELVNDQLMPVLQRGVDEGVFRKDLDLRVTAHFWLELIVINQVVGDKKDFIIDFFLRGILTSTGEEMYVIPSQIFT